MQELNDEQRQVLEIDGPLVVVAGPGTGKTKTLVAKINYLITSKKVDPSEIVAITFTKKAAKEIEERLGGNKAYIGTFHSFAFMILGYKDPTSPIKGYDRASIKILTDLQQKRIFSEIKGRNVRKIVSNYKNSLNKDLFTEKEKLTVREYNAKLKELGLLDYDDLLINLLNKLQDDETFRKQLQSKIKYLFVDEFQDTNDIQYEIIKLLNIKNTCVIGDPYQSIYSFRGANFGIFEKFKKEFENTLEITLLKNYRNTQAIIKTAQLLFPQVIKLQAQTLIDGELASICCLNCLAAADYILKHITEKVGGIDLISASNEGTSNFRDFAILYRTHYERKAIEKKLLESGIPFQIVGGGSIWETEEVGKYLEDDGELDEQLKQQILSQTQHFKTKEEILKYRDYLLEHEFYDSNLNAVTLLTMHAAKGLEFENVFIVIPSLKYKSKYKVEMDEEKRLFYVAMTRARQALYLLHTEKQEMPFYITEIRNKLLTEKSDPRTEKIKKKIRRNKLKKSQISIF